MEQGRLADANATTADLSKYHDGSDDDTLLLAAIKDDYDRGPIPQPVALGLTGTSRRRAPDRPWSCR